MFSTTYLDATPNASGTATYNIMNVPHPDASGDILGIEGYRQFVTMYRTAFPDVKFTIEDQVSLKMPILNDRARMCQYDPSPIEPPETFNFLTTHYRYQIY